jgi:hypothetical protein
LLANLFMHYAFDAWMARQFPGIRFERYCDDAGGALRASEQQARRVRDAIAGCLAEVGLELHPGKTRIVCVPRAQKERLHVGRKPRSMCCCVEDEGCGPSASPFGGWRQTASCCVG